MCKNMLETRVTWHEKDPRLPKGSLVIIIRVGGTLQESGVDGDEINAAPGSDQKSQVDGARMRRDDSISCSGINHGSVNHGLLSVELAGISEASKQANACDSAATGSGWSGLAWNSAYRARPIGSRPSSRGKIAPWSSSPAHQTPARHWITRRFSGQILASKVSIACRV